MLIFLFVLSILQLLFLVGFGALCSAIGMNIQTRILGVVMLILGSAEIFSIMHLIS